VPRPGDDPASRDRSGPAHARDEVHGLPRPCPRSSACLGNLRVVHERVVRLGLLTAVLLMMVPASVRGGANGPEPLPASPIGVGCRQLLLVRAASWTAATGTLERYERTEGSTWTPIGAAIPVDLGRNGMAWGRGLQMTPEAGPAKREGDGKSPAGVYRLGTAFGVAVSLPPGARGFPYLRALPTTYCVEDTRSIFYNQIVDSTRVTPSSWEQWSQMARPDGLFNWGVVVQQNAPEIQKGSGSCVSSTSGAVRKGRPRAAPPWPATTSKKPFAGSTPTSVRSSCSYRNQSFEACAPCGVCHRDSCRRFP
jgi:L,D-peptidoglycan transpeptidase YkuD (ErfK/YbiS/YcfS/YnhG family)